MAIARVKTSSILQGFPKSRSLLAGNAAYEPDNFESIATVIVGSGGSSTITFSSIPGTYAHLQIRSMNIFSLADQAIGVQVNSDTAGNYSWHRLYGSGTAASADASASTTTMYLTFGASATNREAPSIIDVLDYADTNKYKTFRCLSGSDNNGGGFIGFTSGSWRSTSAITSIKLTASGGTFNQYSKFALYGIRD